MQFVESELVLSSNASSTDKVEGDNVNISCSLSYSSRTEATLLVTNAGNTVESSVVKQSAGNVIKTSAVFIARRQELFGPFKCLLRLISNPQDEELAQNMLEMQSNILLATEVQCECF